MPVAERPPLKRIISTFEAYQFLNSATQQDGAIFSRMGECVTLARTCALARRRILLIFLLIRYTGAKLNEVSRLDPFHDIDHERQSVFFRNAAGVRAKLPGEVQISEALSTGDSAPCLTILISQQSIRDTFSIDPAFVRRKFYERAQACGLPKRLGGPEMIRKASGH